MSQYPHFFLLLLLRPGCFSISPLFLLLLLLRPGCVSISPLFLIETNRRPFAQPARQEAGKFEGEVEGAQMQMQMLDEGSVVDQLRDRQVDPQMLYFGCWKTRV